MRLWVLVLASFAALLLVADAASAGEIVLKKSFWLGWKYSTDGQRFDKVGVGAAGLRSIVAGCEPCSAELDAYRTRATWVAVTSGAGGALIGLPIGAVAAGQDWGTSHTILVASGGVLAIVAGVLDRSASKHLQESVRLYNETAAAHPAASLRPPGQATGVRLAVAPAGLGIVLGF